MGEGCVYILPLLARSSINPAASFSSDAAAAADVKLHYHYLPSVKTSPFRVPSSIFRYSVDCRKGTAHGFGFLPLFSLPRR